MGGWVDLRKDGWQCVWVDGRMLGWMYVWTDRLVD